jgi:hypothetical protein
MRRRLDGAKNNQAKPEIHNHSQVVFMSVPRGQGQIWHYQEIEDVPSHHRDK